MKLLMILSIAVFAVGCAKSTSSDLNSFNLNDPNNPNIGASCAPMDIYNQGVSTGIVANIQIAGSPVASDFREYVQVKLSALPQSFLNGDGIIEFYDYSLQRGQGPISSNTRRLIDIVPINNIYAQRRGYEQLTSADIGGFDLNEYVLVINVGSNSQMLDLAYFDGTGLYRGSSYGLLPPYIANPSLFLNEKSRTHGEFAARELLEYHPLNGQEGSQQNSYYESLANSQFCFNGIPASMNAL